MRTGMWVTFWGMPFNSTLCLHGPWTRAGLSAPSSIYERGQLGILQSHPRAGNMISTLRIAMCSQTVLLALLLAAFPAAPQARPLQSSSWDYFSQLTQEKDHPDPAPQLKHGQEERNLKSCFQDCTNYVGGILQKLAFLNSGAQSRFYQDANGLWRLIQGEVESLRRKLSSYTHEGHPEVDAKLNNLHLRLTLLAEKLTAQVSLQTRELQLHLQPSLSLLGNPEEIQKFAVSYAAKVAFQIEQVKEIFQPYVDRLVAEIQHGEEELHRNVVPRATTAPEPTNQLIQDFFNSLTQNTRILQLKIQGSLEHLKGQLSLHSSCILAEGHIPSHQPLDLCLEDVAKEVQERIEEFRRETVLQTVHFTRTLDRETEDMKLKLRSLPLELEEFQESSVSLEDVHVRLASLWRSIYQSLDRPRGSVD